MVISYSGITIFILTNPENKPGTNNFQPFLATVCIINCIFRIKSTAYFDVKISSLQETSPYQSQFILQ